VIIVKSWSKLDVLLLCISCSLLSFAIVLAGLLPYVGDVWWPVTILLFSPRWTFLIPIIVLIPFALWRKKILLLPLLAALFLVIGPIMGLNVSRKETIKIDHRPLRVVSCNLQNGKFDHTAVNTLIINTQPDLVALQELPASSEISSLDGWYHVYEGDLHIFSRYPIVAGDFRKANVPMHKWPRICFLYCTVKTPDGDLTFCTVHLPSPRYGLQSIIDRRTLISLHRKDLLVAETEYRKLKSQEISAIVAALPAPKVIAGDFNMPVESKIYRESWGRYQNAYSLRGAGFGWTEQVSVRGIPVGVRIDHVLTGNDVTPLVCEVGPDVGSDHLPVIADLVFR
jgi:endonuclease/exonuclease/phosphatase family metal-dependent hydrolase